MTFYSYAYRVAIDPNSLVIAPPGSIGQVFAVSDKAFSTPVPTFDLTGIPVELVSGEHGFLPSFQVENHVELLWKSGEYVFHLNTTTPLEGPQGEPGTDGKDGATVIPTAEAILAEVTGDSTPTRSELDMRYTGKGELLLNALDYGVKGDGTTDDGPALQAAMETAASMGKTLLIPGLDYGVGTAIRLPSDLVVLAYGATFHRLEGLGGMIVNWDAGDTATTGYTGRGNITILGLTIDAHGDTNTKNLNILTFNHARNITVRDCTFLRTKGYHALELNAVNGGFVQNCRFAGYVPHETLTEREAIQIDVANPGDSGLADGTMATNIIIDGCRFEPLGALVTQDVCIGAHTQATGKLYTNIVIRNCSAVSPKDRMINGDYFGEGCIVDGCYVDGRNVTSQGIRIRYGSQAIVRNCTVERTLAQGILLGEGTVNSKVIGCTVAECNEGVYDSNNNFNSLFTGNTVHRTKSYAMVSNNATNTHMVGNIINGAGYTTGALGAIRLTGTSAKASVTGNKVIPHGAGTEVSAGVSVAGTATDVWVFGNDFKGMAAAVAGTVNTTGNRI